MSVQLRPNAGHEAQPFLSEPADFLGFLRVHFRNALKQVKLIVHQAHIGGWDLAGRDHLHITVHGLPGFHDAFIGFVWAHTEYSAMNWWKRHGLSMAFWLAVSLIVLAIAGEWR